MTPIPFFPYIKLQISTLFRFLVWDFYLCSFPAIPILFWTLSSTSFPTKFARMCFHEIKWRSHCSFIVSGFIFWWYPNLVHLCSGAFWKHLRLWMISKPRFPAWALDIHSKTGVGIRFAAVSGRLLWRRLSPFLMQGALGDAPSLLRAETKRFGTISGKVYWSPCQERASENTSEGKWGSAHSEDAASSSIGTN